MHTIQAKEITILYICMQNYVSIRTVLVMLCYLHRWLTASVHSTDFTV